MAKMRIKKMGTLHPGSIKLKLIIGEEEKVFGCIKDLLAEHNELSRYIVGKLIDGEELKNFPNYKIEKLYR